jgi:uncharacterized glyoxalase superfamily protein PhnB
VASIVPYFGYRDAPAAIEFLVSAFGMERVNVVEEGDGLIAHAELRHRDGVIMLGSWLEGQGAGTPMQGAGIYLVVDDVDAHHSTAVARGTDIVYGPEDTEFGTRRYRARDPEGYEWSFGTYQPGQSWS